MTPDERAAARERIAQGIAVESGCTIEQARARGMLLGLSLGGNLDPARKAELTAAAGWA